MVRLARMRSLPLRRFSEVRWVLGAVIVLLMVGNLLPLYSLVALLRSPGDESDALLATAASVAAAWRREHIAQPSPGAQRLVVFAGDQPLVRVGPVPMQPYWPFPSRQAWQEAGSPVRASGNWNGEVLEVVLWPLGEEQLLQVFAPRRDRSVSGWLSVTEMLSLALALAGGGLAWFLVGRILAPYGELLEEAKAFAGKTGGGPEDRFLVSTFRQAVEQVAAQERELADRAQELSELAAGLAHELRNNLSVMEGYLRLAKSNPQEVTRYLDLLGQEVLALRDFLERFLAFVRPQGLRAGVVRVEKLVAEVVARLARQFPQVPVRVEGEGQAWADPTAVRVMLENLLRNALEAAQQGHGAQVWVQVREQGRQVEVEVADSGPGIPEALRGQLFRAFVSAKPSGGIGLALARRLARASGGELELVSAANPTLFRLRLRRGTEA